MAKQTAQKWVSQRVRRAIIYDRLFLVKLGKRSWKGQVVPWKWKNILLVTEQSSLLDCLPLPRGRIEGRSIAKSIAQQLMFFFKKKWANPGLFFLYFRSFKRNIVTIFTTNICEKMSIQYTVLGFDPTTFGTWVSSHNH